MKRWFLGFILSIMVTLLCVGCGTENTTTGQAEVAESSAVEENVAEQTTAQAEEPAKTAEPTEAPTVEPTETPTVTPTAEPTTEPKQVEEPAPEPSAEPMPEPQVVYTYTDMTATMYATQTVNVRNLPCTDGEKIGSLSANQEITVLGQCNETGWYQFELDGQTAFVSNSYLSTEKVEETPPAPPAQETAQATNIPRASDYPSGIWHNMGDYSFYIGDWTWPSGATGVGIHLNDGSTKWAWINYSDPNNVALNSFIRANQCNCSEITHGGTKPLWDEATKSYYFP